MVIPARIPETGPGSLEERANHGKASTAEYAASIDRETDSHTKEPPPVSFAPPSYRAEVAPTPMRVRFTTPEASVTLSGDPRVLVALLFAKDAEESLLPLAETAKKLQASSDKREAIRALKTQFNMDAKTTESAGHTATLSVEELDAIMEKAKALGIDTSGLLAIKEAAESTAGADSAEGKIIGLEFPDAPELHTERQGWLEKVVDSFDEATEASRDSQTTINFEIQLQMQNHTNLYTAASQTVAELKRQNGAVSIS